MLRFGAKSLLAYFVATTACAGAVSTPSAVVREDTAMFETFFAWALSARLSGAYLVQDSTLRVRLPSNVAANSPVGPALDSIPLPLRKALEEANLGKLPATTMGLPNGVRIVTSDTLNGFFRQGISGGWDAFRRSMPSEPGYLQLGIPAFSPDSTTALLYFEYHCGPLCGSGRLVHLTRDAKRTWRVKNSIVLWLS